MKFLNLGMKILTWKFGIWSLKQNSKIWTWSFILNLFQKNFILSSSSSSFFCWKFDFSHFMMWFFYIYFILGVEKKRKRFFFLGELTESWWPNFGPYSSYLSLSLSFFFASSFITIHLLLPLVFFSSSHHFF